MNFEDCRNNADRDKYGLCAAGLGKCESDCVFYVKVNKPTNADRIRGMSDEELAELNVRYNGQYDDYSCSDGQTFYTEKEAINHEMDWLRQPAETEGKE